MSDQYLKEGKIYSRVLEVDYVTGKTLGDDFEVCNLTNEFEVKCDCGRVCKAGEANSCSGNGRTGEITGWICNKCESDSDRAYQASTFDVDYRNSMIAESEY